MPYRPLGEFLGAGANKRLSAHTIASFMFLQGVPNFDDLTIDAAMSARILRQLLRGPAVEWWVNSAQTKRPGQPAWLAFDGISMRLTSAGHTKVVQRAQGEERTSAGRRSPYNVLLQDIRLALDLITNGPRSALGAGTALEFIET